MGAVSLTAQDLVARTRATQKAAEEEAAELADMTAQHQRAMTLISMIAAINKELRDVWQTMIQNMR
jgi:hypothetical protein